MEPFIGEIKLFAGNFAPNGWAFCNGQILSIAQNTALFSLLGTMYGGNGQTTFALPDLRGRAPIGFGQGPGLPNVNQGEISGSPTHTLTQNEMPAHNHTTTTRVNVNSDEGESRSPVGRYLAPSSSGSVYAGSADQQMNTNATQVTVNTSGGNQPFSIMQPYLGLNYIIAIEGIYPSRS
jgi:microcystin-dependent protein